MLSVLVYVQTLQDIYAFGVLLWVMLTGEEPWKDVTLVSVAYSVHCGLRLPISHIPESRCSRKLRKLIAQCWEPTPRRRPAVCTKCELCGRIAYGGQQKYCSPDDRPA